MTHNELRRIEPDGTRVYSNYEKYTPVPTEKRKYGINKPDDPRAVRFGGNWFIPMDLVPEPERVMPETRSDEEAYTHALKTLLCQCKVCRRPEARVFRERARKGLGMYVGQTRTGGG